MKAEISVIYLQAKECHRLPPNHQKKGRDLEQILPQEPSGGISPAYTLMLDMEPPDLRDKKCVA